LDALGRGNSPSPWSFYIFLQFYSSEWQQKKKMCLSVKYYVDRPTWLWQSTLGPTLKEFAMADDLKDTLLSTIEASLDAQLRAVRRLRKGDKSEIKPSRKSRLSQVDMAYDVLRKARTPLHVSELLARIQSAFGVRVDRESLVSSLSKKIAAGKRFLRTEPNTFGLRPEEFR